MADETLRVPVWCPICSGPMKGKSTNTWYDWGTCSLCYVMFIEHREQRWRDGWRPSREELDRVERELAEDST
jgi:hypothetical protein